ncbi:MAG: hypothetical protein K9H48_16495 [Melioribacteraceae bacterium]|nr:hypothetical protein [Saprospiraceae bacterium]MCF8356052.1 hypothetical protein [Melioribacteraceae bacterium]MCF8395513.1 hypothetical protein [Melioribacteraceae bacterium]
MLKKWLFVFSSLAFLFYGCSSYVSRYYFEFDNTPQEISNQGLYKETLFGRYNHYYEDASINIFMDIEPNAIGFQIENKLEKPLHIIWDSAKVVIEYERIYKIANKIENTSNEFLEVKWLNKKDTILCSIKNKSKDKMMFEKDSGFVKIGDSFKYYFSDLALKNYKDDFIKVNWLFFADSAELSFINISKYFYKINEDDGKIYLHKLKEYKVTHKDKRQEQLILPDSTESNFLEISSLIELQKSDSLFTIRPTVMLPKSVFSDEIVPATLSSAIYPFTNSEKFKLAFSSAGFINSRLYLILPIKIGDRITKYKFPFKIKDYQILRKG